VETYLYHSKEENVFTLFRAVVDRDLEASAELLRKLLLSSDNSPQSIVAGLLWQLRKLHSLSTLTSRNYSLEEACRTAGIRGKRNQRLYGDALSAFDGEAAERMLVRATEADADLRKYNSRVHELLLDRLLYSIIVDAGRAPAATHSLESPARPLSPSPR
jgi:DNA polymerase-3 subunit delta